MSRPRADLHGELGGRSVQRCLREDEVGRQIDDPNIVASTLVHAKPRLLTFNTADVHRYTHHIQLVDH